MSAVSSAKGKRTDPMSKRIPQNPKYKDVKPTIDTGASMTKYLSKLEELGDSRKRGKEIYRRMKVTTFVQLVIQVNNYNSLDDFLAGGDRPDTGRTDSELQPFSNDSPPPTGAPSEAQTPISPRSTLRSVISGTGELDDQNQTAPAPAPRGDFESPYLLLDVRTKDEYDECHIISAVCYPSAELSKSQNYETRAMLEYKKRDNGKIIIIYDVDERIAQKCANTLSERGYDNIFLLSGGIKKASKIFRKGLISGTVPPSITGERSAIVANHQKSFTAIDIDYLQDSLDYALSDNSTSARLSKTSTTSSRMSQASMPSTARSVMSNVSTASTVTGRKPFKP